MKIFRMIPIENYNHYYISSDGIVYNKQYKRRISNYLNDKGYLYNCLSYNPKNGSKKCIQQKYTNHRLVVMAWKGQIPKDKIINHINGIKNDNRIENLELCTYSENAKHAFKLGLRVHTQKMKDVLVQRNKTYKHFAKKVYDSKNDIVFDSILDCAKYYKIGRTTLFNNLFNLTKINKYSHIQLI